MKLSERLIGLRCRKKLNQKQLAAILDIPQTTYSGYERGIGEPSLDAICRLAKFYDVSIEELLEVDERSSDGYMKASELWERLGCTVSIDEEDNTILVETPEPRGLYYIEGNTLPRGFWFEDKETFAGMTEILERDYERDSLLHKKIYFFNRMIRFKSRS